VKEIKAIYMPREDLYNNKIFFIFYRVKYKEQVIIRQMDKEYLS